MDKKTLRRIHTEIAENTPGEKQACADEEIARRVLQLDEYLNAQNIFIYVSVGHEVSTCCILRDALQRGKNVYVPECEKGGIMHAVLIRDESELCPGMFGIPTARAGSRRAEPAELDCIIVPGVCFDRVCNRLGRGGGYYDRYLAHELRAHLVGVCRSEHLVEALETDPHDRRVDVLVSDIGVFKK